MHTIWITGLSRSGKTTIAEGIAQFLRASDQRVQILDGREIRDSVGDFFGYSKEERMRVNRVLCTMAKILAENNIFPVVPSITPHQESRDFNRRELDPYLEIYLDCSVESCIERDRNNLYKKALQGDIQHFIGVDDPYEVPRNSDCKIDTATQEPDQSVAQAIAFVRGAIDLP